MIFKAITVRTLAPTVTKGTRLKAQAFGSANSPISVTVPYDYEGLDEAKARVAEQLAREMRWTGEYIAGMLPDGQGTVFVKLPDASKCMLPAQGFCIEDEGI